jgi:3alpha(or 20beta)-hydroxysteroid dehydrogenase
VGDSMAKLDGRVALISGGARGLGLAMAEAFVAEGARVMIGDVLDDEAASVARQLGDASSSVHLDVTDEGEWDAAVALTVARFGHLDVLVNNAGTAEGAPLWEMSAESYRRVIEVNQVGVFLGMKAVVGAMTTAGRGSIINISSMDGLVGVPRIISYIASKWAVRGMTKAAAMELGPRNIRVNSIHPGNVHTLLASTPGQDRAPVRAMIEAATKRHAPMGRVGEASEIAKMAVFLASDDSSYSTGSEFVADGGFTAGYPAPGSTDPF